jgi:predicted MFS family arabinose efflux permease
LVLLFETVVVILAGVASVLVQLITPILLVGYTNHLGLTETAAGYLIGAEMSGMAAASLGAALRVHRWSRSKLVLCGLLALAASNLLSIATSSFGTLVALRITAGLGAGAASAGMFASVAAMAAPDRVFGAYTVATLGVAAVALSISPYLLGTFGVNGLFLLLAAAAVPAVVLMPWYPRHQAVPGHQPARTAASRLPYAPALLLLSVNLVYFTTTGGVWPFVGMIGTSAGLSLDKTAQTLAMSQIAGAAGAAVPFLLGTRFGRVLPLAIALVGSTASVLALLLRSGDYLIYAVAMQVFMFMWLVFFPYLMGVTATVDSSGRLVSLSLGVQNVAFGIGPLIAARIVHGGGPSLILRLAIGSYLLTMLLLLPLTRRQDADPTARLPLYRP